MAPLSVFPTTEVIRYGGNDIIILRDSRKAESQVPVSIILGKIFINDNMTSLPHHLIPMTRNRGFLEKLPGYNC